MDVGVVCCRVKEQRPSQENPDKETSTKKEEERIKKS
jgi:hypothetical protein